MKIKTRDNGPTDGTGSGITRRDLLAAGAVVAAAPLLTACGKDAPSGLGHGREQGRWENWSYGVQSRPRAWVSPATEDQLASALRQASGAIRPVGAGHSFTPVAASNDTMITLRDLKGLVGHDPDARRATFYAGTTVRQAGPLLEAVGQGMQNQGDVDPQALAGAIGTSTHGTGATLGSFSSTVTGLRLYTPDGDHIDAGENRDRDVWKAASTSVGALGVISRIQFQNRAAYRLREREYPMPLDEIMSQADILRERHRHFEFFGFFKADTGLVKTLDETEDEPTPPARLELPVDSIMFMASELAHRVPSSDGAVQRMLMRAAPDTERVGRSWEIFPSSRDVRFNEMEYEIPAERGLECLQEIIDTVRKADLTVLFPFEFRYVAADDCWLSPFYGRASASISIHQYWKVDYRPLFQVVEPIMRRYEGRPHWGKLHTLTATELRELYPRWDDFQSLRRRLDPRGRMLTPYLRKLFEEGAA